MKTFKLILFFVFLSNGYSLNDTKVQECDSQSSQDQESIDDFGGFINNMAFVTSQQTKTKKRNLDNLDKKLGYGSFNNSDGQYSVLLVKNAKGDIKKADSIAKLDKDLKKWMNHSKSSSPDDDIA